MQGSFLNSGAEPPADGPLSVADLDRKLKRLVENATVGVVVQGEIRGLKIPPSGHAYFSLRDENEDAVLDAVAYRDAALRARRLLSEGARVVVRGKATVWAPRGKLQLIVDAVRPAGRGALLEALEKLKVRLREEGLFDTANKVPVPTDAKTIGVVTSASGAVIHDIIRVAFRRGSPRILLSPSAVQGEGAPAAIVEAIDRIERVSGVDVILVGRGGGSLEDLMAFNDERVVRRVAACKVPIVSAVGHEVDVTLTDLAADARAATPSQAAEMVVADALSQAAVLSQTRSRLVRAVRSHLAEDRTAVGHLAHRLGDPRRLVPERQQRLDDLWLRVQASVTTAHAKRRGIADRWERRLVARHPRVVLAKVRGEATSARYRMGSSIRARIKRAAGELRDQTLRLRALSPLAVLARGYSIALDADGRTITDAACAERGQAVGIRLHRGRLLTQVLETVTEDDGDAGKSGC